LSHASAKGRAQSEGMISAKNLTAHELRQLAVASFCDPRSVVAFIEGRPVSSVVAARIEKAIGELEMRGLIEANARPFPGRTDGSVTA